MIADTKDRIYHLKYIYSIVSKSKILKQLGEYYD